MTVSISYAILAALFYGLSAPLSKLLMVELSPYFLSSLLYFGAGVGILLVIVGWSRVDPQQARVTFTKGDVPYILAMIVLDIIAPILLMWGLTMIPAAHVALLNNLEIVFTAVVAWVIFKEKIGHRMWIPIMLIILSGVILGFDDLTTFSFSSGVLFVMGASLAWGIENNATRHLSRHNPLHVVVLKGIGSGTGALLVTLMMNGLSSHVPYILLALLLGFVAYGMSLFFYISAQRHLGATRTSAYYSTAPFVGAVFSFFILGETLTLYFVIAFTVMVIATLLLIRENGRSTAVDHVH